MKNDREVSDILALSSGLYPHMAVTEEDYPRALVTRRIDEEANCEYFGAFLPKTAVRIMIDLVDKTFRLRSCAIDIDGKFPVPCTQYFEKRCVAPCVETITPRSAYLERVELAKLFLADRRGTLTAALKNKIDNLSEQLEFEQAAEFRDILNAVEKYWQDARKRVWLDDSVDTYAVEDTAEGTTIFLVSHRGTRILGRKVFRFSREEIESSDLALAEIIRGFYLFYMPREIRVSRDFRDRKVIAATLTERFGRPAKIVVADPRTKGINAARALLLGRDEHELDKAKPLATPDVIGSKLRRSMNLSKTPHRIEAFDVAHISSTAFVAAWSVWINGRFASEEYGFVLSQEKSELAALSEAVLARLGRDDRPEPDLIVLDGGKPQLSAVEKALAPIGDHPPLIAAVKPANKHSSIARFLVPAHDAIAFDVNSPAHAMLQILRDEAHDLANRVHRDLRDMTPFYEARGLELPLIVPIRYAMENGGAEDLRPIPSR